MSLVPYKFPPGVQRNGTTFQSYGRWVDASLMRFLGGTIQPVGGWRKASPTQVSGLARALHAWRDNTGGRWCAIGTNSKLYAYQGGTIADITPTGLNVGRVDGIAGIGYSFSTYGSSTYGTARPVPSAPSPPILAADSWSLDSWGQYLVGCSSGDGRAFQWLLDTGVLPTPITNAPVGNRGLVVTPERFLVLFGAGGDPRAIQWCTQEDYTVWTPSATNTAGSLRVQTDGYLKAARRVRGGTLLWTDVDVHLMSYLGSPLVYGLDRVGTACGIISAGAVSVVNQGAVWMGQSGFFMYNGALQPLPCEVQDYVFSDLNRDQSSKIVSGSNSAFNEVWWFYPSSTSNENDRYVVWNYVENTWTIGLLARTAWLDLGVYDSPFAATSAGYVYEQELGWTNDGVAIGAGRYLTGGPLDLSPGDKVLTVTQVIPDEANQGQVCVRFTTRFTPNGTQYSFGPYTIGSGYVDARLTGRQVSMQIEGVSDADFRIGNFRLDVTGGGRR